MSLIPGARLGPYEIISPLGAGGMGEVYKARDTRLDRGVAVKVLPELFAADSDRAARFEREAQAVAALSHPNILAIYAVDGKAAPAAALEADEMPIAWTDDDRARFVVTPGGASITRVDPVSGARRTGPVLQPPDPASAAQWTSVHFTPDGRSYAANYSRTTTRLFLVEGLR